MVELDWRMLLIPVVGFVEVISDEDYILVYQKVTRVVRVSL